MKRFGDLGVALALLFVVTTQVNAQESSAPQETRPLVLTEAIPREGIKGRFDHFGTGGRKLFISALGNNTVEVIDVSGRTLEHTITGVPNPQGVVFAPEVKKLFVASSKGKLYIYDGTSFDLLTSIDFHGDVDNLRYDAANKRVYVGFGDEETAAIGAVDAITNKRTDEEYKLGAHPESFQLETSGPNIYVNLPDLKQIAVINRSTHAISRWALTLEHNFPMALDERDHRLFVGTHEPARLAVYDTQSGHMIAALPSVQDADDLYYDAGRKRIYMAGGEGFIYAFEQKDADQYQLLVKVPSALGARTAGSVAGKGTFKGGVLSYGVPRGEPVTMDGMTVAPAAGVAEAINFQAADAGNVAATGDFVLTAEEVNPVIAELETHQILVTALHSHMLTEQPLLFFMHFWAVGSPESVGGGIAAALKRVSTK